LNSLKSLLINKKKILEYEEYNDPIEIWTDLGLWNFEDKEYYSNWI